MTKRLISLSSQVVSNTGQIARRTLNGRTYAIVPCVALVPGVRNGELVPNDEVAVFPEGWNGRPVPLGHPQVGGAYVSANQPDVWETVIGTFFNAQIHDGRLKGEMWLDEQRIRDAGGPALQALERIDAGEMVEVSTAYWAQLEDVRGEYEGEPYSGIQRGLRPDHVALLATAVGACSIEDGCGANRYNARFIANEGETMSDVIDEIVEGEQVDDCQCDDATDEPIVNADGEEGPAIEPVAEATPVDVRGDVAGDVEDVAALIYEMGGVAAVKDLLAALRTNQDEERSRLTGAIVANQRNQLTTADLQAMTVDALRRLHKSISLTDFTVNSGSDLSGRQMAAAPDAEWVLYESVLGK